MTVSVIIVNYNVKYFLEQCLCSVNKALEGLDAEVLVIDNNSSDGSLEYLQPKFSGVRFIANKDNMGFAKANNQCIALSSGKYLLLLNPDTVVAEDTVSRCIAFLESHSEAGAIGVRMIDGSGNFLKESKRGFPSSWAAFCKLSGITTMFPRSKRLAQYYMGHLDEHANNAVDVLAGAFMMVKREVIDKTGGFDEQFFMYGEDIDLSYRIIKAGYLNYYLAETTIIHFKGESTSRDFRYVKLFYKAMAQFVRKHSPGGLPTLYKLFMQVAIWSRAAIAMIRQLFQTKTVKPIAREIKYFLTGDVTTINNLEKEMNGTKQTVVKQKDLATAIIFCEGNTFSFLQLIDAFQKQEEGLTYSVYAGGSHSIVGSHSKNKRGDTLAL